MKKVLFSTLAMMFALVSFTACDKGEDNGGGGDGGLLGDGKETPVITGTEDVAKVAVFSDWDDEEPLFFLNFANGKMSLDFQAISADKLIDLSDMVESDGVTANPSTAKGILVYFVALDANDESIGNIYQEGTTNDNFEAQWLYVDRNVKITGTDEYEEHEDTYDLNLKKGWNIIYLKYSEVNDVEKMTFSTDKISVKWVFDSYDE